MCGTIHGISIGPLGRPAVKLYGDAQSKFYREHVPMEVMAALATLIRGSYADSAVLAERWTSHEAKDAIAIVRRADIETALPGLATKYKALGVTASKVSNANGTDWHTELRCGAVVHTVSKTEGPDTAIRPAEYRKSLAKDHRLNMPWAKPASEDEDDADVLWACVTHGPSINEAIPAYIRVVFPLRDGSFQDHISITEMTIASPAKEGAAQVVEIREVVAALRTSALREEHEAE